MTKLGFESSIKFLNNILNFGKEYEELGCSPSTIPGIICNINYETRKIWLRPSETNYLNKKLSKLLNKWKVKNIKPLKEYEIDNKNIYIYWKINDEIGRCFIIKRINKQPLIHYIDNGKIEEMSNEIKIFKIDNDMICGDLAYPLCFVLEYLPSVYCEKYDIPKISNFEIEDFIHVFIINCPGDYVYGFGTSSKNTLSLIENNFIKNYEIGKKLGKVKYLCKGNDTYVSSKSTIFQFYEIIEEYADCFVIGVPDEKHIYVRSINLSIGYLFFFQYLNKFYRKEKSRKELNVNKIDIKNYREIYVFYDSSTDNFYRTNQH
ncbi:Hypothetical protein SRAE_1000235500 [Strongyloides ratti]|uniref:Uncharacterized protein n=1 Tax=Strongyloides ratti TaxID=34506 RepID=A0A090MWQ6_STRRB|nr:Hypothetical protein SRAE_1000235500 [Strongyloides ratti]CEF64099.1 Hypothetical protein SRAE_1000235500 [Strongyloides ratti]